MLKVDEKLTALVHSQMPFASFLDLELVEVSAERVVGLARWTSAKTTAGGGVHGGYLFRAVRAGRMQILATTIHVGRTTIVVQTDVLDDRNHLVCRTTQTQLVLGPKHAE